MTSQKNLQNLVSKTRAASSLWREMNTLVWYIPWNGNWIRCAFVDNIFQPLLTKLLLTTYDGKEIRDGNKYHPQQSTKKKKTIKKKIKRIAMERKGAPENWWTPLLLIKLSTFNNIWKNVTNSLILLEMLDSSWIRLIYAFLYIERN